MNRGPPGGGPKEQQHHQRQASSPMLSEEEGAYSNQRMTYICSSLIGTTVSVETDDGVIYEGVFRTFSPDLDITLEQVHTVNPDDPGRIDPDSVKLTGVFSMKRIIRCWAVDVDLNAAKIDQSKISGLLEGKLLVRLGSARFSQTCFPHRKSLIYKKDYADPSRSNVISALDTYNS